MANRVAYLGPAGTFTEAAALSYDSEAALLPFPSISAVFSAVESQLADEGVVPIENSLEGSVTETLDILIHESTLTIYRELAIPIDHCLIIAPGRSLRDIAVIYSHPQAIGQCRRYIEKKFPGVQVMAALSTASAVQDMMRNEIPAAAISTARAADIYGAMVAEKGIQDNTANLTRFIILSRRDSNRTGRDKTSICFSFRDDEPGMLYSVMGEFALRNINLAKVESRPNKEVLGRYIFLVDIDGHKEDQGVMEALAALSHKASMMKILGSYPRYSNK
jgi:prephenate dehydratase